GRRAGHHRPAAPRAAPLTGAYGPALPGPDPGRAGSPPRRARRRAGGAVHPGRARARDRLGARPDLGRGGPRRRAPPEVRRPQPAALPAVPARGPRVSGGPAGRAGGAVSRLMRRPISARSPSAPTALRVNAKSPSDLRVFSVDSGAGGPTLERVGPPPGA